MKAWLDWFRDLYERLRTMNSGNIEYEVQHTGYINGKPARIVTLLAYRRQWNSTSQWGDICGYLVGGQNSFNTPSTGTTYYLNSTSAQDATGGTGVDRVRIEYLDANGETQLVTANLNGTTAVSLGSGFSFIQSMGSYHSTTADRVAAGNITISSINGVATEATTIEMIRANGNQSQSGRYKIPTGKHAHLMNYHVSTSKLGAAATFEVQTRALIFNDVDDGLSTSYHYLKGASLVDGEAHSDELHYRELPGGCVIKLSCIPSNTADGTVVSGSLDLILMDD
jgi:hypothetical protein